MLVAADTRRRSGASGVEGGERENAGSPSPAATTFSSAILIKSADRFFAAASLRIATSAICRAWDLFYFVPTRWRTSVRCRSAVRPVSYNGSVPSGSSTVRRTKSTTISGYSSGFGNRPTRRYDFSAISSAS